MRLLQLIKQEGRRVSGNLVDYRLSSEGTHVVETPNGGIIARCGNPDEAELVCTAINRMAEIPPNREVYLSITPPGQSVGVKLRTTSEHARQLVSRAKLDRTRAWAWCRLNTYYGENSRGELADLFYHLNRFPDNTKPVVVNLDRLSQESPVEAIERQLSN